MHSCPTILPTYYNHIFRCLSFCHPITITFLGVSLDKDGPVPRLVHRAGQFELVPRRSFRRLSHHGGRCGCDRHYDHHIIIIISNIIIVPKQDDHLHFCEEERTTPPLIVVNTIITTFAKRNEQLLPSGGSTGRWYRQRLHLHLPKLADRGGSSSSS